MVRNGGNQLAVVAIIAQAQGAYGQLDLHRARHAHQRQRTGLHQCLDIRLAAGHRQTKILRFQPFDTRDQMQRIIIGTVEHHVLTGILQFAQHRAYRHRSGHAELVQPVRQGHGQKTRHAAVVGTGGRRGHVHDRFWRWCETGCRSGTLQGEVGLRGTVHRPGGQHRLHALPGG